MSNLEFMSKFKPETRCIKEFEHWIICIRGKQATLGDAVILLKEKLLQLQICFQKKVLNFQKLSNGMRMLVLRNLVQ